MKRALVIGGAVLALSSSLALAQPDSLLPDMYDDPTPAPAPAPSRPAPAPTVVAPDPGAGQRPSTGGTQTLPPITAGDIELAPVTLPGNFPSIEELEDMSSDEIDELFGLKPKFDIPAGARRAVSRVGVIAMDEGGFPSQALAGQPASLVRNTLGGIKHGMVSRWGHILLRRTLASRLDAPAAMNPVEFAALRAAALNTMGEANVARTLVQDVDSSNYDQGLTNAAFDAYLASGDLVGMCPVARLKGGIRKDQLWELTRYVCMAFAGEGRDSKRELDRALGGGAVPRIDVLLAQRYAGAGWDSGTSVTIEWDEAERITPWRYSIAAALGLEVPTSLMGNGGEWYDRFAALSPAVPLDRRAAGADRAGREGILSSSAMIDLYAQIFADEGIEGEVQTRANSLREAYVATPSSARVAAMREIWGAQNEYGRLVLTAYAAARINPNADLADDAPLLIASMLAAGLDRNAMRWANVVDEGSQGWALLALAQERRQGTVSAGAVDSFIDNDSSADQRKSQFLVAGLAGLGRLDQGAANSLAGQLGVNLSRESNWSRMITKAAEVNNPAMVSLLAGLGMQGSSWDKMTARHLYLIVRSLDRVGLSAEARMIAAEAVARG
jgi:hypothetical protein